jgi:hypothetical protein
MREHLSRAAFQCPAHHHHLAAGIVLTTVTTSPRALVANGPRIVPAATVECFPFLSLELSHACDFVSFSAEKSGFSS